MPLLPALPTLAQLSAAAAAERTPVQPRCFAYDARAHVFACIGHAAIGNMDHVVAEDQATNLRIDAVGPGRQDAWTIAAIGGRATTPRRTVERALAGLAPLRTRGVPLADAWTRAGKLSLHLASSVHEGDASYENLGDVRVRCASGAEIDLGVHAAGIMLGGPVRAFASPDGAWVAVSIAGDDGGEGAIEYRLDTFVIDAVATCAAGRPVVTWPRADDRAP